MPPAGTAFGDGMKQLGPYRLLSQLAVGGMAEIYVAKTAGVGGFEKVVALKIIHPNYSEDPEFVQMLVDEAKLAVQLQHANIVQTFDLGRVGSQYYIAMELIDGVDLYKLLRTASDKEHDFPFDVAAFIALETANGLDYAHRKRDSKGRPLQIVHRDISPQNILVSTDGEVKIVDFGIAKAALRGRQTAAGVIKGKYYYMSPEQAWGDPIDSRTDVFSTGILLYEMIVGQMLYLEEDLEVLLQKVRKADIAPPSMLRANVPEELEAIVMTALKKRVTERYQSAQELATALQEWLHKTAPDFNRARLGAFLREALGPLGRDESEELETQNRDPRIPTAHTREMLERDENSLLFKLSDLRPPEPEPNAPQPKPQPQAKPRQADQATSPVSLPEVSRALARPPSDFEESDRTVVDTGNTLLANIDQPEGDSTRMSGPPVRDLSAPNPLKPLKPLKDDPAEDADTMFDDEDEATLAGEPPPKIPRPAIAVPAALADDDSRPLPGVRPLEDRPTVARQPRPTAPQPAPSPQSRAPSLQAQTPSLVDDDDDDEARDERTAQHKKPKHRPLSGGIPQRLPEPDRSDSVTMERQRRITSPQKAAARVELDEVATPPIAVATREPAPPPPSLRNPPPAQASSHHDEPTRIPPPMPPPGGGPMDAWGFPTVSASDLPGSAGSPSSHELHSTDLLPKSSLSGRWLVIGAVVVAAVLTVIVVAALTGSSGATRGTIEVVSSPPGAEVNLDGSRVGKPTPVEIVDVDPKSAHHVRVSLKGYDVWESDVRFADSPNVRLQAVLVTTVGTLVLSSTPPGAEAIVNGRIRGLTPVTVDDLPPNDDVTIELRLRGFKVARQKASWKPGSRKIEVAIPLEKAR